MDRRSFLPTLAFASGYLLIASHLKIQAGMKPMNHPMRIRMIYNNTGECPGMENGWGLAAWIETGTESILFDTGGDAGILMKNIRTANLDPKTLSGVIISHDHWDHKNGLASILDSAQNKPRTYVVSDVADSYREDYPEATITGVDEAVEITGNLWSTGQIEGSYRLGSLWEQSLFLLQDNGMVILTGCSHPGITTIAEKAKNLFPSHPIRLVAGGFHLKSTREKEVLRISGLLKELGVEKVAPSHCTGKRAIELFRSEWTDRFVAFDLGDTLEIHNERIMRVADQ